ncbi:MAG: PaaI family thioesterase [Dehalococcoidia bacterium]|nr:PaaI family thioesterase [Dehalococcoidia bacterium]
MPDQTPPARNDEFERQWEQVPLHRFLGVSLVESSEGFCRLRWRPPDPPPQHGGSVHGGILAALVDITILRALFAVPDPSVTPAGTADLNITYMRPALGKRIFSEGHVIEKGRQLAVGE